MAHLDTNVSEAVEVSALSTDADALDAFDLILSDEQQDEETTEPEGDEPDGDEAEEADEEEEQEEPAIPAPVSFNTDEKAVFATMTPEQQRAVAAIETRRNADVQKATTEAAQAKLAARSDAEGQLIQIQQQYANELAQYAKAFEVEEPDYGLIATNPQAFAEQMAYYKQATAQRQNMMQQADAAYSQAQALEAQKTAQWETEQLAILAREIPEWNDTAKREKLMTDITALVRELGIDDAALANVDATELLALRAFTNDRADAIKYRELVAKNMEQVRSFKGKPAPITLKPGTAQSKGSGQKRALADATSRLKSSGSDADALAAFEALGL